MDARQRNVVIAIAATALVLVGILALALRNNDSAHPAASPASASSAPRSSTSTPVSSDPPSTTAPTPDRCHTSELSGEYAPYPEGGAGNSRFDVRLTNTSHHACTVNGYPGIGFLTTDRKPADLTVERGSAQYANDPGPTRITLAPGDTATASIGYAVQCTDASTAVYPGFIEVTPPDETDFVLATVQPAESLYLCQSSRIRVTALLPGTTGAPPQ